MNRAPGPHPEAAPQPEQLPDDAEVFTIEAEEQYLALDGTRQATKTIRARMAERAADRLGHRRVFNEQLAENMVAKLEGGEPSEEVTPQNWFERRVERKTHKKLQKVKDAQMRMRVEDTVQGGKGMGRVKHLESIKTRKELRKDILDMRRDGLISAEEAHKKLTRVKYDGRVYKDSRSQRKARDEVREAKLDLVTYAAQPRRSKVRASLETRLRQSAEKPIKKRGERQAADLENPGYYFESSNILSLKRSMQAEAEKQYSLAIAEAIGKGDDESAVSFSEIETKANLEAVARYFGFKSWEDAERRVPSWIIDGVTQMLGLSEEELEAEAMREQEQVERRAPNMRPAELPHDEPIEILRGTEEQEDSPEIDHEESSEIDTRMVEYIHVIAEQNSEIYQSEIEWLAANIEKQLASSLIGAATLAEKRSIIDETYAVNIAFLLDVPKDELKNPAIVPKPLIDKILADINSARQEMKKSQKQKEKPATPTPAPKKPKAAPVKRETISSSSKREVTEQERNAGSSLEALRNIIND